MHFGFIRYSIRSIASVPDFLCNKTYRVPVKLSFLFSSSFWFILVYLFRVQYVDLPALNFKFNFTG